ncbi:Arylsulfatase [Planctomycetes bacterium CA13]|uniref:Arylsulfatase n=2 Tax=Novipirellula herctigrandis TaxID=2527986 RepID=A0A5C5Z3M3_9BACT|nr:Arylsulfatase [Planctomycetes bacterium CA13]
MHNMHLLEREVTIPELLQQSGYGTAHFGKWHIGMTSGKRKKPSPTEHGFDYWFGLSNGAHPSHKNPVNFLRNGKPVGPLKGYSCQLIVDDAIRWLDQKESPDQPFFLNLWFNEPHAKLAASDEIVSLYGDLKDESAIYSATVDNTDRAIGRLVAKLKAMGKLDSTLIIYSSDHGSYRTDRNGGLNGNKGSNFEGGLRSPGIFFWPRGIRGGRIEDTACGSVDLLPTICGLIGIDEPASVHLDGADLSPLLTEKGAFRRDQPLLWLAPSSGHLATLRDGSYTLMGYRGYQLPFDHVRFNEVLRKMAELAGIDPSSPNLIQAVSNTTFSSPEFQRLNVERVRLQTFQEAWIPAIKAGGFGRFALYDLSTDPLQQNDISKQRPKVTERLKKKLLELYEDVMAYAPVWEPVADAYATPTAASPARSGTRQEFRRPRNDSPPSPKVLTSSATRSSRKLPNVVVLLADDLGSKDLGCNGGPVKTPVLDSLAARGVRFTDFHAGAAVCSPSRATLLTGRQNLRTGIYGVLQDQWHNMHLLEREVTIAEVLQKAGYGTAHFGKWHIGMTSGKRRKPSPTQHGFDYWFGLSNGASPSHKNPVNFRRNGKPVGPLKGYSCQLVVDDAIDWLETKANPDQPFFMNIWFNEPHSKLAAPDEIVSLYGDLKDESAIYSATVDNTDRAIGRLVAKLKAMGKLDNTLIIYSSDHGSYRTDRNGGLNGNKGSNFEGGLRSPGIFFWPRGFRGGRVENTPSGSVDLLPTICGLAGIEKPKGVHLDGADLSPLLIEKGTFNRSQPMFWLSPSSGHLATLREGNYTLMGYSGYKLPSDQARKNDLTRQMARLAGIDPSTPNLGAHVVNTTFSSPEYNRLKGEFVRLRTFQEAWIPTIKAGGFSRFALYDSNADPLQQNDISKQRPKVTERLKKKLQELYEDVMADAPDWEPLANVSTTPPS